MKRSVKVWIVQREHRETKEPFTTIMIGPGVDPKLANIGGKQLGEFDTYTEAYSKVAEFAALSAIDARGR